MALSEPAGTAQEIDVPIVGKLIHQLCLIDIDISILDNLLEILYSNRVLHTLDCCFTWQIYAFIPNNQPVEIKKSFFLRKALQNQ